MTATRKRWSEQELELLKRYVAGDFIGINVLELFPDRTQVSIYSKITKAGLNRFSWDGIRDFENLEDVELAYIAGIIDGEGHINAINGYCIQISNTDMNMLSYLKEKCGGVIHKISKRKSHHSQAWVWRLGRKGNVFNLLRKLMPFLITKRVQALRTINRITDKHKSLLEA